MRLRQFLLTLAVVLLPIVGCVQVDPDTGKTKPRGNQRYKFEKVTLAARRLEKGMSKLEVTLLLGTPARRSQRSDVWIYLPERPAVLIPGRALRLEFRRGLLVEHGYRPILLGEDL